MGVTCYSSSLQDGGNNDMRELSGVDHRQGDEGQRSVLPRAPLRLPYLPGQSPKCSCLHKGGPSLLRPVLQGAVCAPMCQVPGLYHIRLHPRHGQVLAPRAFDKQWHIQCFVCSECKKTFEGSQNFYSIDNQPVCGPCAGFNEDE